jgi:putative spermidine/putrescine transport system permease protein
MSDLATASPFVRTVHRSRADFRRWKRELSGMLKVSPFLLVLIVFLVLPLAMMVVVSFWLFVGFMSRPAFVFNNYIKLFTSASTINLYLKTFELAAITWAATLLIGFTLAYHITFDVRRRPTALVKFLILTVPFLISSIIRTISWVPLLAQNGVVNSVLLGIGIIREPLHFLLYSEFAVIVAYVHMYSGVMMGPIYNTMSRIDRSLLEAASDCGASGFQIFWRIILPLTLPGIAIGSIFVVALVIGDVAVVRLLGGGQIGTVAIAIYNEVALVQFPLACASAVLLLAVLLVLVTIATRFVNIRREI